MCVLVIGGFFVLIVSEWHTAAAKNSPDAHEVNLSPTFMSILSLFGLNLKGITMLSPVDDVVLKDLIFVALFRVTVRSTIP